MEDPARRVPEWCAWLGVALWSLFIFVSVPFARRVQSFIEASWGGSPIAHLIVVVAAGSAVYLAIAFLKRRGCMSASRLVWIVGVAGGYVFYAYQLKDHPAEAIHFVEYGVLGVFVFHALSYRVRDATVYVAACLVCAMIGTADEILQWIVPNRYWDYRDVWFNAFAGGFIQVAIAFGLRPRQVSQPVQPRSVMVLLRLIGIQIVILMATASNTPQRVDAYTQRLPRLAFLRESLSMMIEYGHRYRDRDIGVFYSRFTRDELKAVDADRAEEAARVLDESLDPKTYMRFIEKYSPVTDPFLHEARVHLFQRDLYRHVAGKHKEDPFLYGYHRTIAYCEQMLLERYFGATLSRSMYRLREEEVKGMEADVLPGFPFESYVSRGLVTRWEEWQLQAFLLSGLALCIVLMAIAKLHDERGC